MNGMHDDEALLRRIEVRWLIVAAECCAGDAENGIDSLSIGIATLCAELDLHDCERIRSPKLRSKAVDAIQRRAVLASAYAERVFKRSPEIVIQVMKTCRRTSGSGTW